MIIQYQRSWSRLRWNETLAPLSTFGLDDKEELKNKNDDLAIKIFLLEKLETVSKQQQRSSKPFADSLLEMVIIPSFMISILPLHLLPSQRASSHPSK
jgi:hypothetical protein